MTIDSILDPFVCIRTWRQLVSSLYVEQPRPVASALNLYEGAVTATYIHRFCLIHPTFVFRPEHKCICGNRTPLGAHVHGAVIKWFTCILHAYGDNKDALKVILLECGISQPATVGIPANDVQVVTPVQFEQYLRRRHHPNQP